MDAPINHGTFRIERMYAASPARVFAAWADAATKARWFVGPPDRWRLVERALDFRVGGTELLHGRFADGRTSVFTARYHAIVPDSRLVYAYDMHLDGVHHSTSLATVEFGPAEAGGSHLTFTEQVAFLDGTHGTRSREAGTAAHLNRLAGAVDAADDPREIVSLRMLDAPREVVFAAFRDPEQLARWWGPAGYANTFHAFDFQPGGTWRFLMRGPDGREFPLTKRFGEIAPPERIVLQHTDPEHAFTMTMDFAETNGQTRLMWRMRFESADEGRTVRAFVLEANEQNFDRLAAHLATIFSR